MKRLALNHGKMAILDDEDYEVLWPFKWHFNVKGKYSKGYVQRSQHVKVAKHKYKTLVIYLHVVIMKPSKGFVVDHINGDTLDNRKENLRIVPQSVNMRNRKSVPGSTSKFVGVHKHKLTGKWRSQIRIDGKTKSLGLYETQSQAKEARDAYIVDNALEGFRR